MTIKLRDTYYVALLGSVGCVLDSAALARFFADDIAARAGMFALDMDNPLVALPYLGRSALRGVRHFEALPISSGWQPKR